MQNDLSIPYGYCHCRCGQKTKLAPQASTRQGWTRGEPMRFIFGHAAKAKGHAHWLEEDRGYITPCHIWQGNTTADGKYGRTRWNGAYLPAHRIFFQRAGGVIPAGWEIDHLCRVTLCVNPAHLEAVTRAENCRRKPTTRLTAEIAAGIRAERERLITMTKQGMRVPDGARKAVAERYGVSVSTVKGIWYERTWR